MISYFANDTMIDIKICDKHKTFFSSFINIKFRQLLGSCEQSTFLKIILILQNSILYYYEFYLLGLRLTNRTISFLHACSSHGISDISTKSHIIGTAHKLLITISQQSHGQLIRQLKFEIFGNIENNPQIQDSLPLLIHINSLPYKVHYSKQFRNTISTVICYAQAYRDNFFQQNSTKIWIF